MMKKGVLLLVVLLVFVISCADGPIGQAGSFAASSLITTNAEIDDGTGNFVAPNLAPDFFPGNQVKVKFNIYQNNAVPENFILFSANFLDYENEGIIGTKYFLNVNGVGSKNNQLFNEFELNHPEMEFGFSSNVRSKIFSVLNVLGKPVTDARSFTAKFTVPNDQSKGIMPVSLEVKGIDINVLLSSCDDCKSLTNFKYSVNVPIGAKAISGITSIKDHGGCSSALGETCLVSMYKSADTGADNSHAALCNVNTGKDLCVKAEIAGVGNCDLTCSPSLCTSPLTDGVPGVLSLYTSNGENSHIKQYHSSAAYSVCCKLEDSCPQKLDTCSFSNACTGLSLAGAYKTENSHISRLGKGTELEVCCTLK